MSQNHIIGRDGKIPWHIPRDLQFFRDMTENRAVIMGRRTWESLPVKPLPNRFNIVLTSNHQFLEGVPGITAVANTLDMALIIARTAGYDNIFLIGGSEVYVEAMSEDIVDHMYVTLIHETYNGDTYFPEINPFGWDINVLEEHLDLETCKPPYSIYHFSKAE